MTRPKTPNGWVCPKCSNKHLRMYGRIMVDGIPTYVCGVCYRKYFDIKTDKLRNNTKTDKLRNTKTDKLRNNTTIYVDMPLQKDKKRTCIECKRVLKQGEKRCPICFDTNRMSSKKSVHTPNKRELRTMGELVEITIKIDEFIEVLKPLRSVQVQDLSLSTISSLLQKINSLVKVTKDVQSKLLTDIEFLLQVIKQVSK